MFRKEARLAMSGKKANTWGIPKSGEREEGVLYMHPLYSKEFYEGLKAIEVQGVRFERAANRKGD